MSGPNSRKLPEPSNGLLEAGMTFNVEPAIYIDGLYGIRRCEMVTVAQTDCEILTDFHSDLHELDYRPQLSNLKFLWSL